jgi:hypothetical protein
MSAQYEPNQKIIPQGMFLRLEIGHQLCLNVDPNLSKSHNSANIIDFYVRFRNFVFFFWLQIKGLPKICCSSFDIQAAQDN